MKWHYYWRKMLVELVYVYVCLSAFLISFYENVVELVSKAHVNGISNVRIFFPSAVLSLAYLCRW